MLAPRGYSAFGTTVAGTDVAGTIKVAGYFTGVIIRLGDLMEKRGKIDTTHSTSTNGRATFVPEDIIDGGEYEIDILHDTQVNPPWGDAEVIVITLPKRGTAITAATKTFKGFLMEHGTSFPLKGSPGIVTKCKLCVAGEVTTTPAA